MALLLALLTPKTQPPADVDLTHWEAQYDNWTKKLAPDAPSDPNAKPMQERKGLALAGLYDMLYYSGAANTDLGVVLANLVNYKPIYPPNDDIVKSLRRGLRQRMIEEFKKVRGSYP